MAPWSNGYDFPLSPGRSGFNSPWGRQLRAYRLTARTSGSQPDGRGSNPRTLAIRGDRRKGVRHRCAEPDPFPARRPGNRTRLSESRNAGLIPAEPTKHNAMWSRGRTPASGAGERRFESCHRDPPVRPMARRFSYKEETSVRFTHWGPICRGGPMCPPAGRHTGRPLRRCRPMQGPTLRNGETWVGFPPAAPLFACSSMQSGRFLPGQMRVQVPPGGPIAKRLYRRESTAFPSIGEGHIHPIAQTSLRCALDAGGFHTPNPAGSIPAAATKRTLKRVRHNFVRAGRN